MKKQKITKLVKYILKTIIIFLVLINIYRTSFHYGKPMNAEAFTSIGINSIFEIDANGKIGLGYFKVVSNSIIIILIYSFVIIKIKNYYDGLKNIIRIKSDNLNDYIKKSLNYLLPSIIFEVFAFLILVIIVMNFLKMDGINSIQVFKNIVLMFLFYTFLPVSLIFVFEHFELYLVSILVLSLFAPFLIYILNIVAIILIYILWTILTYLIILLKEKIA